MSFFVFLLGVLSFLAVFTTIVFVHEMGHFLTARFLGFKVDVFSIGFGKPLLQWNDKHGTKWQISGIPLGGYVKFAGDSGAASVPDSDTLQEMKDGLDVENNEYETTGIFHFMPVWKRALVTVAGPVMNFIFAILIFSILFMAFGKPYTHPVVGSVVAGGAAEEAGFLPDDRILSANGEEIESFSRLAMITSISARDPIRFIVLRGNQNVEIIAIPRPEIVTDPLGKQAEVGRLGIAGRPNPQVIMQNFNPLAAVIEASAETKEIITDQIAFVGRLFRGKGTPEMLGGPLRIMYISGKVGAGDLGNEERADTRDFWDRILGLIRLTAVLSVAIGLINLAPVPMLDGGHLVFYAYEAIFRRPLSERIQVFGFKIGLFAIFSLLAFATFNDLRYFNVFGFFG
ncbi:RIP metalloprotease [Oceanicaulis sp. AH-315-P02]|nr:RIP metalloprotease [Robiginitomaculum sp.]MBN4047744.1 RIP metalloprotease [Oceanicaulis sp. AH-315-P02]